MVPSGGSGERNDLLVFFFFLLALLGTSCIYPRDLLPLLDCCPLFQVQIVSLVFTVTTAVLSPLLSADTDHCVYIRSAR